MASQNDKVHGVVHLAASAAAGVGAGLAQIPGSDMPLLATIQTGMIVGIAQFHGVSMTQTAAADLLLTFSAGMGGRALSQFLVGWMPGIGNSINSITAFAVTEAIGWAADAYFEKEGDKT